MKKERKKLSAKTRWVRRLTKMFRDMDRLSHAMILPINTLASTMMTLEVCDQIIEHISQHIENFNDGELPSVFIRQKDAANSCAQQMRSLLVVAGLTENSKEAQPLMELLAKLSSDE